MFPHTVTPLILTISMFYFFVSQMEKMMVIEDNFQQIIHGAGLRPEFSDSYISQYIPTTLQ